MSGSNWRAHHAAAVRAAKAIAGDFPDHDAIGAAQGMGEGMLQDVSGPADLLRRLADKIDPK